MKFGVAERYRLEIYWQKIINKQEGTFELIDCYLGGPVIKEVSEMVQEDSISLDFGNQYLVFVDHYYIAKLSWNGVRHTPDKIYLSNVILTNKFIHSVPKLSDDDFIVVDTRNHEDEKHDSHLTYPSYLIKKEGDLYNFRR